MYNDYFVLTSDKIAIFILTFVLGLFIARFLSAKGIGGCLTYLVALVVLVVILSALYKGYSYLLERITYNLENYIYFNSVGIIGAIAGVLVGFMIFKRK